MAEKKHVEPEWERRRFHTPEQAETYKEKTLPEYRATTPHRLSVALGATFTTSRGVVRKPGERVDYPGDFGPFTGCKGRAVSCGALVELTDDEWEIVSAKGTRRIVLVPHTRVGGISTIGDIARPEHYDREGKPARQVVRDGCVVPAEAVPGVDGEQRIRELIKQRFIAEFKSREAVQQAIKDATKRHWENVRRSSGSKIY